MRYHEDWWLPEPDLKFTHTRRSIPFRPYDGGRYWVRLFHRLPNRIFVGPLDVERMKAFRDGLPDDAERKRLDALLHRYAPGKVRWTLPAIYALGPVDWALQEPDLSESDMPRQRQADLFDRVRHEENMEICLVALPTLGVHLRGIDRWIRWEFRFRKVGRDVRERLESSESSRLSRVVSDYTSRAGRYRQLHQPPPHITPSDYGAASSIMTIENINVERAACLA
jgi:hypothetical protein